MELPDGFWSKVNVSEQHKQLVRAALTELKYEKMKDQTRKVFSDPKNVSGIVQDEQIIKVEPTYHQVAFYGISNKFCLSRRGSFNPRYRNNRFLVEPAVMEGNLVKIQRDQMAVLYLREKISKGKISKYNVCVSIYHWTKQYPNSYKRKLKQRMSLKFHY